MARIGGFTERRQLRRAADQALMTAFALPPALPAESAPPPSAVSVAVHDLQISEPAIDDDWPDSDDTPPMGMPVVGLEELLPPPAAAQPLIAAPRGHWYQSPRAISAAIALAVVAIAVSAVLLFTGTRDSGAGRPAVGVTSTPSAPPPTSAVPAPSAAAPQSEPPAGPALPPAPPPPPDEPANTAGAAQPQSPQYPPRQSAPAPEQQGPQVDVTRAPFSATPPPPRSPQYNQGDGQRAPHRGCCGF
jgi:hypothetical protein